MDMNGNYAAGVLEGMVHFFPKTVIWLKYARTGSVEKAHHTQQPGGPSKKKRIIRK
jgi:hypothetical protein